MLHCERFGNPEGETILFLHGAMVGGWMWTQQVADLADFDCLVPDLPGIGHSHEAAWHSLQETAVSLLALLDEYVPNKKVHVVGLSLGAIVGLHLMSVAPQRFARAVLSGPLTQPFTGPLAQMQKGLLWLYHNPRTVNVVGHIFRLPADVMTVFAETAALTPKTTYPPLLAEIYSKPLPAQVGHIAVPTLVVTGAKDTKITRQGVSDLPAQLPHSEGYLVPSVGHQWNAENPALFSEMVRCWLQERPLPTSFVAVAA